MAFPTTLPNFSSSNVELASALNLIVGLIAQMRPPTISAGPGLRAAVANDNSVLLELAEYGSPTYRPRFVVSFIPETQRLYVSPGRVSDGVYYGSLIRPAMPTLNGTPLDAEEPPYWSVGDFRGGAVYEVVVRPTDDLASFECILKERDVPGWPPDTRGGFVVAEVKLKQAGEDGGLIEDYILSRWKSDVPAFDFSPMGLNLNLDVYDVSLTIKRDEVEAYTDATNTGGGGKHRHTLTTGSGEDAEDLTPDGAHVHSVSISDSGAHWHGLDNPYVMEQNAAGDLVQRNVLADYGTPPSEILLTRTGDYQTGGWLNDGAHGHPATHFVWATYGEGTGAHTHSGVTSEAPDHTHTIPSLTVVFNGGEEKNVMTGLTFVKSTTFTRLCWRWGKFVGAYADGNGSPALPESGSFSLSINSFTGVSEGVA